MSRVEEVVSTEMDTYYKKAVRIIEDHMDLLGDLAEALIEKNVLTSSEIREIVKQHS